jgi:hypothetical protein
VLANCLADATIAESAHRPLDCALAIKSRERRSFYTKIDLVIGAVRPIAAEVERALPALPGRKGQSSAVLFATRQAGALSRPPPAAQPASS